jgi:hypothetical protein
MLKMLGYMRIGSEIYFESIKVEMPDGEIREIKSIYFKVVK